VDDEPMGIKLMEAFVNKINYLELACSYDDPTDALNFLKKEEVDIVFTDIQMPGMNGLSLVKSLPNPPLIIFVSAHRDFVPEGFETDAVDYLVKPVTFPRFEKAVDKARNHFSLKFEAEKNAIGRDPFLFVKSDNGYLKILFEDIIYFQAKGDYVLVVTKEKKDILWRITMSELENKLPVIHFIRAHKSYIVNINSILSVYPAHLELINKMKIPLSKSYKAELNKRIGIN
jgi:DNA-binding LytR/AlgR family response regulator